MELPGPVCHFCLRSTLQHLRPSNLPWVYKEGSSLAWLCIIMANENELSWGSCIHIQLPSHYGLVYIIQLTMSQIGDNNVAIISEENDKRIDS